MKITQLHDWNLPARAAIALQSQLASKIQTGPALDRSAIELIAGIDVSSTKFDHTLTAGIIVCRADTFEIIEQVSAQRESTFPYVPGLLSFREIPAIIPALEQLEHVPDVFMVDGQGIAHPRRLGIASHIGLLVDRPTIGVGKSPLVGGRHDPGPEVGSNIPLLDHGEIVGSVIRTKQRSNPLYISVGHKISLGSAVALVFASCRGYRLPELTRLAHLYVNQVRRAHVLPAKQ